MSFFLTFLAWLVVLFSIVYVAFCFTYVKEGSSKQVVRFGAFRKSLFAKKGFKLDSEWNVVTLAQGEKPEYPEWMGGLRWVSWLKPLGIDKIYTRTMKFVKALPDGGYKKREDQGTDFLLSGTQYQYALLFANCEDSNGVPLSGQMTMTVRIMNPYKALFLVKNWFDALVGRVQPRVRDYISNHEYKVIIYDPDVQLDHDVLEILQNGDPNVQGGVKICDELLRQYGIELMALETVNIDPPEGYREATTAKWKAGVDADAQATRIAAIDRRMSEWVQDQAAKMGMPIADAIVALKADGTYQRQYQTCKDLILAEGGNMNVNRVEFGTPDGGPLPSGLQFLSVGGSGGAGMFVGGKGNKQGGKSRVDKFSDELYGRTKSKNDGSKPAK